MIEKTKEKEIAIKLRNKGLSYGEILKEVLIAKSTLSLWLRDIRLSNKQKQRLKEKKIEGRRRGSEVRHQKKLDTIKSIKDKSRKEIKKISRRELWLIGIALYWAEGHKEKDKSSLVIFTNSDPKMIVLYLKWLKEILKIENKEIIFRINLHETSRNRLEIVKRYWVKVTHFPKNNFESVTWKKSKINTNRKNIGKDYYGLLNIKVRKSINLNRKIQGWIEGICK